MALKALVLGPLHGLGGSNRIAQITKGAFQVKPGSLFPSLHRMDEERVALIRCAASLLDRPA
jgi:DNA-binding PadR family transcriptional regulator